MTQLSLFDYTDLNFESDDSEISAILTGVRKISSYSQDNMTGFPIYGSGTKADQIYRDIFPQQVEASEAISPGDMLNIYYDGDALKARLASAADPLKFCNSMALSAASIGSLVYCAVKSAILPTAGAPGSYYLDITPGKVTSSPVLSSRIIQKVGEIAGPNFCFYFHTPALVSPFDYQYLQRS